ncbi:MAG: hypothetical protein R3C97_18545 [Geminicoccaceae bacterium]
MWTPLIGPMAAACFAILVSPVFLYVFVAWILLTRFFQTLMLLPFRDTISGLYPFLLYYNQVYGRSSRATCSSGSTASAGPGNRSRPTRVAAGGLPPSPVRWARPMSMHWPCSHSSPRWASLRAC